MTKDENDVAKQKKVSWNMFAMEARIHITLQRCVFLAHVSL